MVATDASVSQLREAVWHPRIAYRAAPAENAPFAARSVDLVTVAQALHWFQIDAYFGEVRRVLVPGGLLAVSVPRYWPEKLCWRLSTAYHQVPGGHIRIFRRRALTAAIGQAGFYPYARHHAHALHAPYWWLRCLFWSRGESFWPVRLYHRLLVWDLMHKPRLTRWLDRLLNPLMGKSLVLYFVRNAAP